MAISTCHAPFKLQMATTLAARESTNQGARQQLSLQPQVRRRAGFQARGGSGEGRDVLAKSERDQVGSSKGEAEGAPREPTSVLADRAPPKS